MKWVMFIIIIVMISSVLSSQDKIIKELQDKKFDNKKNRDNNLTLESYLNKKVNIEIDNDDINNSYIFSSIYNTTGEIVDYDNEWIEFRYKDKSKNKIINKFFRIRDIVSINEIK